MNDNDEEDEYRNNSLIGNVGYKFNEEFQLENSFRLADIFYEYDEVNKATDDNGTNTKIWKDHLVQKLFTKKTILKILFLITNYILREIQRAIFSSKQNILVIEIPLVI